MITDEGVKMPRRATEGSAGYDFFAPHDIEMKAYEWYEIGTGVYLGDTKVPAINNWFMICLPKSGLGFKYCIRFANTAGIIDQDYPGEIRCKMMAEEDCVIKKDKAFMQGIFMHFMIMDHEIQPEGKRTGGFGSTGA